MSGPGGHGPDRASAEWTAQRGCREGGGGDGDEWACGTEVGVGEFLALLDELLDVLHAVPSARRARQRDPPSECEADGGRADRMSSSAIA